MKTFHVTCTRYYKGEHDVIVSVEAENEEEAYQKAKDGDYIDEVEEGMKHEDWNEDAPGKGWEVKWGGDIKEIS